MLEIQRIRNNSEEVIEALKKRHFDAAPIVDELSTLDAEWRSKKGEMESVAADMNKISKEIGLLFREGKQEEETQQQEQHHHQQQQP